MPEQNQSSLTQFAVDAWQAGLVAVDMRSVFRDRISADYRTIRFDHLEFDFEQIERIRVVGAGKAVSGMLKALRLALGEGICLEKNLSGWLNIPRLESSYVTLQRMKSLVTGRPAVWEFGARPLGENLPTENVLGGTLLIQDIVNHTSENELCIGLFSGGGSALLCNPAPGVSLDDKRELIKLMSSAGASISQMNTVRKQISTVKGGRLVRRFSGQHFIGLTLSDVLGDDLGVVASGPSVQNDSSVQDALDVLESLDTGLRKIPRSIKHFLESGGLPHAIVPDNVTNLLVGNIRLAMKGVAQVFEDAGFEVQQKVQADEFEDAEKAGRKLAVWLCDHAATATKDVCLVSGGEPVVKLNDSPGRGGRNLHLALAAIDELLICDFPSDKRFVLISGGTDGEDGTTSVAGAIVDQEVLQRCRNSNLNCSSYLRQFDSWSFFESLGGSFLQADQELRTNVGDVRIAAIKVNP